MKQILLCFLLLFMATVVQPVYAQTNVSGTITKDSTWDVAGSSYTLTGAVTVASGKTLTIQPGVTVKFPRNDGLSLRIQGTLIPKAHQPVI